MVGLIVSVEWLPKGGFGYRLRFCMIAMSQGMDPIKTGLMNGLYGYILIGLITRLYAWLHSCTQGNPIYKSAYITLVDLCDSVVFPLSSMHSKLACLKVS